MDEREEMYLGTTDGTASGALPTRTVPGERPRVPDDADVRTRLAYARGLLHEVEESLRVVADDNVYVADALDDIDDALHALRRAEA